MELLIAGIILALEAALVVHYASRRKRWGASVPLVVGGENVEADRLRKLMTTELTTTCVFPIVQY